MFVIGSPSVVSVTAGDTLVRPVGLEHTFTDQDGVVFNLSDPSSGVFLAAGDVLGMGEAPGVRFVSQSSSVAGSRYRGQSTLERPVAWRVAVVAGSSAEWVSLNSQFRRAVRRGRTGTWAVKFPGAGGQTYYLDVRGDMAPNAYAGDPVYAASAEYDVALVNESGYWRGETVTAGPFSVGAPTDFFDTANGRNFISSGNNLASAAIVNEGDVDAWPVYTLRDQISLVSITVDGHTIGSSPGMVADDVMVIDTDPRRQSAFKNGVRVRGLISPHDFAPIPPGNPVPLTVAITGTGSVSVSITPRFEQIL